MYRTDSSGEKGIKSQSSSAQGGIETQNNKNNQQGKRAASASKTPKDQADVAQRRVSRKPILTGYLEMQI